MTHQEWLDQIEHHALAIQEFVCMSPIAESVGPAASAIYASAEAIEMTVDAIRSQDRQASAIGVLSVPLTPPSS